MPEDFDAVLLDIEGTTTPISFVYDVLFPFAREHVEGFLRAHAATAEVREDLQALSDQAGADADAGVAGARPFSPDNIDAAVANVRWQMDADRKTTALKSLQGKIWRDGYDSGELRGVVFDDVAQALRRWAAAGKSVAIYSSGSVEAQKLLFANSTHGDLTQHLVAHFDTTTGPKREAASYTAIANTLALDPRRIVFATDIVAEANAAAGAGLQVVIMDRPGNAPTGDHPFPVLKEFGELG